MPDEILVINAGSSSIKVSRFARGPANPALEVSGQVDGIGTPHPQGVLRDAAKKTIHEETWPGGDGPRDHEAALGFLLTLLDRDRPGSRPAGIGHRIVHGGMKYSAPVEIDGEVIGFLKALVPLAPLHVPANLSGVKAAGQAFPGVPQVACFDTAFHHGRPFISEAYALPHSYYEAGIRRYGFHGLSYEYIAAEMAKISPGVAQGRMIVCHLGNGASVCAIKNGRSVETSMGFTACDGLPMGTRCGQIDPGVLLYLMHAKKYSVEQLLELTHKQGGLLGVSGVSSDMRDLLASTLPTAREAVDMFVERIVYFIGAYAAVLGGVDGVVFTAGIGEHAAEVRAAVCRRLAWLGIDLDDAANTNHAARITTPSAKVSAWVVPTNEELVIARHVERLLPA